VGLRYHHPGSLDSHHQVILGKQVEAILLQVIQAVGRIKLNVNCASPQCNAVGCPDSLFRRKEMIKMLAKSRK
jgi:hypothetical protein